MFETSSRLLGALVYPRTIHDFVELVAPLHSPRDIRARVVHVRRETADVSTLVLETNRRWRGHRAGQWVTLGVEIAGVRRTRCFSIASGESGSRRIELTIKAQPGGAVTPALVAGEALGQIVTLSEAQGDFVLPDVVPERLLLVSGGSGITPVMAMLRTLVARGHRGTVVFLHHARSAADVVFRDELVALAKRNLPGLSIVIRTGPLGAASLAESVPDAARFETWACGPEPFLAAVQDVLGDVHVERFTRPGAVATDDEGDVTFARSGASARGKATLLVLAEGAGLQPKSGCRMGICHTCKCRKVSGATKDLRTGEVSTEPDVDIQLCVSAPMGPVTLDL